MSEAIIAGFGTVGTLETESASSQQAAGIIHWQCCIVPRRSPACAKQRPDPTTAEAVVPRKPMVRMTITLQRNAVLGRARTRITIAEL